MKKRKIGRNEKCPCGSGLKYKRCHGDVFSHSNPLTGEQMKRITDRLIAKDFEKRKQQGFGREIISSVINGKRCVAVGGRIMWGEWKTFHDFLYEYLIGIFGSEWYTEQKKVDEAIRHPFIKIIDHVLSYRNKMLQDLKGGITSAPFTGAVAIYMWLSYNLYLIAHNSKLVELLIIRLKNADQFVGAYYETYVAAMFIKAGFRIEFDDESDGNDTHCEFNATHIATGKKYSVEAKMRNRLSEVSKTGTNNFRLEIGQPLNKALKKTAQYERIIFIDLHLPLNEMSRYTAEYIAGYLRKLEKDPSQQQEKKQAYVLITNHPYHFDLETQDQAPLYFMDGYNMDDFGFKKFTVEAAVESRKKHLPIHELWASMSAHTILPATFDGSIPEFEQLPARERLMYGQKYIVKDENGADQEVELTHGTLSVDGKHASCICRNDFGKTYIIQFPLSDEEIRAYKVSPDTFFGVYDEVPKGIEKPIEMFDFMKKGHGLLSKEELISRLSKHHSVEILQKLTKDELLDKYCILMTNIIYSQHVNK